MKYLPLFIDFNGQTCLVAGGGQVALRKIELLLAAGASPVVVAPEFTPEIDALAARNRVRLLRQPFRADLLAQLQPRLVIAATSNPGVNRQVFESAEALGIICNAVDQPAISRAIFPAIVDRSPVQVAISTGGSSPTLARYLRTRIEQVLPTRLGPLASWISSRRPWLREHIPQTDHRQRFWDRILDQLFYSRQQPDAADDWLNAQLTAFHNSPEATSGRVYLIGVGPGDPDLLTLKALRVMQQLDVVVYDRLVSPPVLDMTRRDARRIYVGKQRDQHTVPQQEINQLLVKLAREGKKVGRLKGGDPFIFGRGGEEVAELAEAGVDHEVIPGITAGSGCATYAGIPLTHRDYAQSVRFVTAHLKEGVPQLPWHELIFPWQTLVIYMGLYHLALTVEQLRLHGLPEDWPIALISKGTTPEQDCLFGTLGTILARLEQHPLESPTLIITGQVVTLSPEWPGEKAINNHQSSNDDSMEAGTAAPPRTSA